MANRTVYPTLGAPVVSADADIVPPPSFTPLRAAGWSSLPETHIWSRWEFFSPDDASRVLEERNNANRHVNRAHVRRLVSDMREGRYLPTHQGLAFDLQGTLLDGQHRLIAITESGWGQWLLVTGGLPLDAQTRMDLQRRRQVADFYTGKHKQIRQGAARLIVASISVSQAYSSAGLSSTALHLASSQLSVPEVLETLPLAYANALELLAGPASAASRAVPWIVKGSGLAAAATLAFVEDVEAGAEWLSGFTDAAYRGSGDPRTAILNSTLRVSTEGGFLVALRAALLHRGGKEWRTIRNVAALTVSTDEIPWEDSSV